MQLDPLRDHGGGPVASSLLALAHVVEESSSKEFRITASAGEEPAGGGRRVGDVSRVLRFEQGEEGGGEPLAGEGVVVRGRRSRGGPELADPPQHQTMSFRIWFPRPPMTQPIGL